MVSTRKDVFVPPFYPTSEPSQVLHGHAKAFRSGMTSVSPSARWTGSTGLPTAIEIESHEQNSRRVREPPKAVGYPSQMPGSGRGSRSGVGRSGLIRLENGARYRHGALSLVDAESIDVVHGGIERSVGKTWDDRVLEWVEPVAFRRCYALTRQSIASGSGQK
jgi:hypothetical protein